MTPQTTRRHLVTGAGSGIGAQVARQLMGRGDRLVLVARSESRARELADEFTGAEVVVADLSEPGTLNGLGREVDGPLDSVVHVAGAVELAPVARLRLADFEQQLAVNLTSPAVLTREFLPHLRSVSGMVVFVSSTSGLSASPEWGAYAASKAGLRALADSLRAEEAKHGVRVTTVFPSRTATAMQEKVHDQEGADYDAARWIQPATVAATILHVLDLERDATIPEVTVRPGPR